MDNIIPKSPRKHPPGPRGLAPAIRKLKLRHPDLSDGDIARKVGCDRSNVRRILTRFLGKRSTQADLQEYQQAKADVYDAVQMRILASVTPSDIKKAPLMARVASVGILEDKSRVIKGQATSINVQILADAVEAARQIEASRQAAALEAVRARMGLVVEGE